MTGTVVIGIDLGTTKSCVAVWIDDQIQIIPNVEGNRVTPSCVAFTHSHYLVGDAAKRQVATNPTNTIYDTKRLIGMTFNQILAEDMELWPFKVIEKDYKAMIEVSHKGESKQFVPQYISSFILAKMKETAEAYIGLTVDKAVITVPAHFNSSQRQATIEAGKIAGFTYICIVNEPTAAAIAYRYHEHASYFGENARNILVFDLGGGTLDVSLVYVAKDSCEVKATFGDTHLGGVDFDNNLVTYFAEEFGNVHSLNIKGDRKALERLRVACEKAKKSLSLLDEITIEVDCLSGGFDFTSTLSRDKFEKLNTSLFEKCRKVVRKCIENAKINKGDVDDVVLVGGSTRIPMVQKLLEEFFTGNKLYKSLNRDEVVAYGAAIQGASLSGLSRYQHLKIVDGTPLTISTKSGNGEVNIRIPWNSCNDVQPLPVYKNKDKYYVLYYPFIKFIKSIMNVMTSIVKNFFGKILGGNSHQITLKLSEDEIKRMIEEAKKYKKGS